MPDRKIRKQLSSDDLLSDNAGQPFNPPTFLYDAACCAENVDSGRDGSSFMYEGHANANYPDYYAHQDRLRRQTIMQGSSTLSRVDGDFDYIGGVPKELMNGK